MLSGYPENPVRKNKAFLTYSEPEEKELHERSEYACKNSKTLVYNSRSQHTALSTHTHTHTKWYTRSAYHIESEYMCVKLPLQRSSKMSEYPKLHYQ